MTMTMTLTMTKAGRINPSLGRPAYPALVMGDSPAANDLAAAVDRLKADRPDEAVAICRALVATQAQDVEAWHLLGAAHASLRQYPQPAIALQEAARLMPN